MSDYYDVLGVSRTASRDEIRRAYRAKARHYHPDLNPGDDGAAERLKEINEAYEVLRDPERRAAYDRFGKAGVGGRAAGPSGFGDVQDLGDIFEQFFGFGGTRRRRGGPRDQRQRGDDLRVTVDLAFEEAVFGKAVKVQLQRREACSACGGSGAAAGSQPVRCPTCDGAGEVRRVKQSVFGAFVNIQTCPDCRGRGERAGTPCPECQGARRTERRRTLEVDVPAGVENGTQIRLSGEGDHGLAGGPPGDLYVALRVSDHAVFDRRGNHLHLELWLNPADAALGAEVEVPTVDGTTRVQIPPGTQTGDEIRLDDLGVPYLKRRGRGDEVITVFVRTPVDLDKGQRELLSALRDTLPEAEVAQRSASLWDRVREKFTH